MTSLFRSSVLEGLPDPVKSKLEVVVNVNSMSKAEFCDHVIDAVDRYRKSEKKAREQEKEKKSSKVAARGTNRKRKKKTDKIQAPVSDEKAENPHINVKLQYYKIR